MAVMEYTGQTTYRLSICGLTRDLPVVQVSPGTWIASFVMLGDVALVNACAEALAPRLKDYRFDFVAGPEAKVLPLLHALATQFGQERYVVCRKNLKSYMKNPLVVNAESITTTGVQTMVLDEPDTQRIRGKRVAIVDDVVSTGGSLQAMEELMQMAGAKVACRAAVLKEGDFYSGELIYLAGLPVFTQEHED
jgi:adenine phosphoribosyltransferase